jgi:hypothetical protein
MPALQPQVSTTEKHLAQILRCEVTMECELDQINSEKPRRAIGTILPDCFCCCLRVWLGCSHSLLALVEALCSKLCCSFNRERREQNKA